MGGEHAYRGRLGKDRSLGESRHSSASSEAHAAKIDEDQCTGKTRVYSAQIEEPA
jgi:hypothetical protein